VALPAFAMGLQNAALRRFGGRIAPTTYVSGMLTDLAEAGVEYLYWLRDRSRGAMGHRVAASPRAAPRQTSLKMMLCWQRWTEWTLTYREICRKAHQTPNPAPAPAAMRTRFGRLALASMNFRYFFGPNLQRSVCRLGNNAPIIPSPIIVIAAISLSLLPTIEPSLSFIEIDLLPLIFARFPHGPRHITFASTPGSGRRQSERRL
jgi:hypothetical protein